jgi:hypothetical protein
VLNVCRLLLPLLLLLQGEISMLEDSPYQMRAPCLPAAAHDAFQATQLLRNSTKRIPRRHPLPVSASPQPTR